MGKAGLVRILAIGSDSAPTKWRPTREISQSESRNPAGTSARMGRGRGYVSLRPRLSSLELTTDRDTIAFALQPMAVGKHIETLVCVMFVVQWKRYAFWSRYHGTNTNSA